MTFSRRRRSSRASRRDEVPLHGGPELLGQGVQAAARERALPGELEAGAAAIGGIRGRPAPGRGG